MRIMREKFIDEVVALYVQNPCYISSIALWKTEQQISQAETYKVSKDGKIYLYAIKEDRLIFYWSNDLAQFALSQDEISKLDLLILHDDFYKIIKDSLQDFVVSECNPLLYNFSFQQNVVSHEDYYIVDFNFASEEDYAAAAKLINSVYEGYNHNAVGVKSWTQSPAFDKSLWIWIKEQETNQPVALGISTYQESVRETYLDWIQVSAKHHKKGLGRMLIGETINRSREKSDIIRVTGIADQFYIQCGFVAKEKWRYIAKG